MTSTSTIRRSPERRLHHVRLLADVWRAVGTTDPVDRELRAGLAPLFSAAVEQACARAGALADIGSSLRELGAAFGRGGPTEMAVEVRGDVVALDRSTREAVFRLALDWLLSAGLDARASMVSIVLDCSPGSVVLRIRDDGVGLVHRSGFGPPWGLRVLQRRTEHAGGHLRVRNVSRRGVEAVAAFPVASGA